MSSSVDARGALSAMAAIAALASFTACAGENGGDGTPMAPEPASDAAVDPGTDAGNAAACTTQRQFFAREVWGRVLGKVCISCHAPDGVAAEQNAMLRLLPSAYPGFLDANYENATFMAKFSFDGKPVLLLKPLGMMAHGGGVQLREGSEEYAILERFTLSIEEGETCTGVPPAPSFDDVILLDAEATFRKASLQLAGRLPTAEESQRLQSEGDAALAPLLDALMAEEAFVERVVELYNDLLLTDFYLRYVGAAIGLLNKEDYPNAGPYYEEMAEADRALANRGIAREPLWIIAHVVRQNRPFSEILTANYTVVSAGSAKVYGLDVPFADPTLESAPQEVQVMIQRPDGPLAVPHAGLLTTPAFLNRFPTSPTNRSRHRARKLYELFLATDILKAADRPLDPLAATRFNNPTRDDPQCNGCHRQIDPIAGAFMKWSERDQERYLPDQDWHADMVAPGFGQEVMDTADFGRAQQWLAQRIVEDPRFVLSTVFTAYKALTGRAPLDYPRDPTSAHFAAELAAWEAQDATFRAIGQRFVDDGMSFKTVVRELAMTPYFRAANANGELDPERAVALDPIGTGRLISPERLALKIAAVTGLPWARSATDRPFLLGDYRILYGGIDSDTVVERLTVPNGIMANVGMRMANEVSCRASAWDFTRPKAERLLFPEVELTDVPETEEGAPDPAAVERIKANIRHLHARVLGERLEPTDPEIERTYGLFFETWQAGRAAVVAKSEPVNLPGPCRARENPLTREPLADGQRLERDERYAVRAWMAVMTYLLSDYAFLYEP